MSLENNIDMLVECYQFTWLILHHMPQLACVNVFLLIFEF